MKLLTINFFTFVIDVLSFPSRIMLWLLPKMLYEIDFKLTKEEVKENLLAYSVIGWLTIYMAGSVVFALTLPITKFHASPYVLMYAFLGYLLILMALIQWVRYIFSGVYSIIMYWVSEWKKAS